jgi:hypothetical protein
VPAPSFSRHVLERVALILIVLPARSAVDIGFTWFGIQL